MLLKKICIATLILVILASAVFPTIAINNEQTTIINFDVIKITERGKYISLSIANCINIGKIGDPSLPTYVASIALKQESIKEIIVKASNEEILHLDAPVIPSQKIIPLDETPISFSFNKTTYAKDQSIPDYRYIVGEIGYLHGYPILTITLFPVEYNPKLDKITFFKEFKISIIYNEHAQISNSFRRSKESDISQLKSIVDNPESITLSRYSHAYSPTYSGGLCNAEDTYEWVLITNNELNETDSYVYNWTDLLLHRSQFSGLNTTKITVEDIIACTDYWNTTNSTFNDTQAHIREFCKDAYQDWGTEYILIGGKWSGANQIVPYRVFYDDNPENNTQDHYPCDLYYSNLDNTWKRDTWGWGGGLGEANRDLYTELNIGRLTVYNASHISNIVEKIIWYDTCQDSAFLNKTAFFGGNMGWTITSADYMEEIRNGTVDIYGFKDWNTTTEFTFDISARKYYDWGDSIPTAFQTIMNNDECAIINHMGHGSATGSLNMNSGQIRAISNTKLMFMYTQECSSADYALGTTTELMWLFESNDSKMFATVQNTGYGWGSTTNTYGPNQEIQRHFWHYLFNNSMDNWTIGKALSYGKDKIAQVCSGQGSYPWHGGWYGTHLFGDPAQRLRLTADVPIELNNATFNVSHELRHDIDWLNFTIDIYNATKVRLNITDGAENEIAIPFEANYNETTYWCNITMDGYQVGDFIVHIYTYNKNHSLFSINKTYFIYPRSDVDMNNITNNNDISIITSVENWGQEGASRFHVADVSGNGIINNNDISIITSVENWGTQ